jgi:hypothetical protein
VRAADAGVLVDAGGAVGAEAVAESDAPELEVLLELGPLLGGDVAVLGRVAQGPAAGDELLVAGDDLVLEHSGVAPGGIQVEVPEQRGGADTGRCTRPPRGSLGLQHAQSRINREGSPNGRVSGAVAEFTDQRAARLPGVREQVDCPPRVPPHRRARHSRPARLALARLRR